MKSRIAIFILLIMAMPIIQAVAADEQDTTVPDSVRIERLAGLCEVWGVAKYFHPYVAYKDIDWDEALIKTISRVNKAVTSEDYKRAIEYMLTFLKDPNTYVIDYSYKTPRSKISDLPDDNDYYPQILWTEDSIAVVVANDFERLFENGFSGFCRDILLNAEKSRGVVFDIRNLGLSDLASEVGNYVGNLEGILKTCLPDMLTADVAMPVSRRIILSPNMDDNMGRHEFSFIYGQGEKLLPNKAQHMSTVPLAFVVNEGSADILPFLGGLQKAGQASIIYEGPFDLEGGIDSYKVRLPDEVEAVIRLSELINSDGTESVHPDLVIPYTTDTTLMDCPPVKTALDIIRGDRQAPPIVGLALSPASHYQDDAAYDEFSFMKPAYRMMALFMAWNEIKFLYPFVDKLSQPWDSVLEEFIPIFESADTKKSYAMAINRFRNRIQNSNTRICNNDPLEFLGTYYSPVAVQYMEGETVVTYISDDNQGESDLDIVVGDVVLMVDGEDVNLRRKRLAGYLSASTPQAMEQDVNTFLFASVSPSDLNLRLMAENGDIKDVIISRNEFDPPVPDLPPGYREVSSEIIYIRPFGVDGQTILDSLELIHNRQGLIIDLRGDWNSAFLHGAFWSLADKLAGNKREACHVRAIERRTPDPDEYSWVYSAEWISPEDKPGYSGDIALLVDATTLGNAEKYCLHLKAAANAELIGTPTNGTSEYVAIIDLPGDLQISYTNAEICHPDGSPVYGIGIQPDILVEPTIEGIRQGKDEILDAAIEYLQKQLKK